MKRKLLFGYLFLLIPSLLFAWGFWGHRRSNRISVFCLPEPLLLFYKNYIEYITDEAPKPDERRFAVEGEAPKHYIDIDHFGEYPFSEVPRKWKDAVAKFSEDTLIAYGILPWNIQWNYYELVKAFKQKNVPKILKISADLGHYIADAHVPLHTTENYNGQFTGQKGIHGFWESRIPELFGDTWDYYVGKARYIEDPLEEAWETVLESHRLVDSVLSIEKELSEKFPEDKKYSFEKRGNTNVRVYSYEFSKAYYEALNGMQEKRLQMSVYRIASYFYSAWIDAGRPSVAELLKQKPELMYEKIIKKLKIEDREALAPAFFPDAMHVFLPAPFRNLPEEIHEEHLCCKRKEKV